jgi:hypothetical protein
LVVVPERISLIASDEFSPFCAVTLAGSDWNAQLEVYQLLRGPSISRISRQIAERVGHSFSRAQLFQISKLKNRGNSQMSHRVLLGRRHAREPYSMNIPEICGDLMWLSDNALRFSFYL